MKQKPKVWILVAIGSCLILCLSFYWKRQPEPGKWTTLAELTNSLGGHCFVRQERFDWLFCDVGFGYVDSSGTEYSYYLDHDAIPWYNVRLTELNGRVNVSRSGKKVASFDFTNGMFQHEIKSLTYNKENGLQRNYPESFFLFNQIQ